MNTNPINIYVCLLTNHHAWESTDIVERLECIQKGIIRSSGGYAEWAQQMNSHRRGTKT